MVGVKSKADGDYCSYCGAKVNVGIYNFCPKCGNALNLDAMSLKEHQENRVKIELLDELASEIKDENSLKIILKKLKDL